jgi:plastocyanin
VKALAVLVAVLVAALALAPPGAPSAAGRERDATATTAGVSIGDNRFSPRSTAVRRGGSVTWRWRGRRRHDVYFVTGPRGGRPGGCGARRPGRCALRFRRAGRYGYVCTLHGTMAGTVRVR